MKDIEEKTIKEFLNQMASQNNRCTKAPYFYVIRDFKEVHAPIDNCEYTKWYFKGHEISFESKKIAEDYLKENGYCDDYINELEEYGLNLESVEKGMFLTETDAINHLKNNNYHYTRKAHAYIKHAWRSPEMTEFFRSLFNYFDIPKGNLDL